MITIQNINVNGGKLLDSEYLITTGYSDSSMQFDGTI
jgi:hypothetical protein